MFNEDTLDEQITRGWKQVSAAGPEVKEENDVVCIGTPSVKDVKEECISISSGDESGISLKLPPL